MMPRLRPSGARLHLSKACNAALVQLWIGNRAAFLSHPRLAERTVGLDQAVVALALDHVLLRRPAWRLRLDTGLQAVGEELARPHRLGPRRRQPGNPDQGSSGTGQAQRFQRHHCRLRAVLVMHVEQPNRCLVPHEYHGKRGLVGPSPMAGSASPRRRQAATTVLRNRQAIVIGPAPPGTGVMAPATVDTASWSTSPTIRLDPSGVATGLIPTSITMAPGLTQSAPTRCGRPVAATRISATRQIAAASRLRECTSVTVQSAARS